MLTVGEFSKICQVSVKTLHHYDRIGLLRPQKVDPFSGYRYYGKEQVERMLLIGRLKHYGFSLKDVKLLLECKDERVLFSKLWKQKEKLKLQKREMELVIGELSAHLQILKGQVISWDIRKVMRLKWHLCRTSGFWPAAR